MDILAHALWATAGVVATHRRWPIAPRTAVATIALAVTPDLGHMLPMLGWSIAGAASMALHGTRHGSWRSITPLSLLWGYGYGIKDSCIEISIKF